MKTELKFQLTYLGQKETLECLLREGMIKSEYADLVIDMIQFLEKDIIHPIVLKEQKDTKKREDEKLK